jgi:catechol 2,3-dioxygenase-like lactoylglutathione lyase family enzyme
MVAFAEEVLGLERRRGEDGLVAFELPDGDTFEVCGPKHPAGGHPEGIAAGFLVDDAEAAAEELRSAGVEVSELASAGKFRWAYFRAPDGNLYEVTSGPYERR